MTDEQLYYMGDAITVKANEFTYTHKKFVKFTLDAAGTQDIPADFRMKEGNITLYAQWVKKEKPSVTPVTGDSANLALWAGAMLLSCAGIVLLSQMKKRASR